MKQQNRRFLTLWGIGAAAVLIATTLTAATYAWFTANREVETDKVTARTGSTQLELQISRSGGADFSSRSETDKDGRTYSVAGLKEREHDLMPVSTADLKTFVGCPVTDEGEARRFLVLDEKTAETMYYHDILYLRLTGDDSMPEDTQADLYLEDIGELPIVQAQTGELLTATRLGLVFEGADPIIFRFAEEKAGAQGNTVLGGKQLGAGEVIGVQNGGFVAVSDPSKALKDYQVSSDNASPERLTTLKLNQIYQLDVFFYLEGCDPDCVSEVVGTDRAELALAFFAVQS